MSSKNIQINYWIRETCEKEMEGIKRDQTDLLELKNTNVVEGINIKKDQMEERISELKDRLCENIQSRKMNEEEWSNFGTAIKEQIFWVAGIQEGPGISKGEEGLF